MPYFHNKDINVLLIHIPKTGGSSLEDYFSKKYNIAFTHKSLYGFVYKEHITKNPLLSKLPPGISLQHLPYKTIMQNNDVLGVNKTNLKVITIVRNPYDRCISDLFYLKLINKDSTKEQVYTQMVNYIRWNRDNHSLPQHLFLMDENNELLKDITILRTEDLSNGMFQLGYKDFNVRSNYNKSIQQAKYDTYLNSNSIKLINKHYDNDFKLFGYQKKNE